jgi:hypothetical protein
MREWLLGTASILVGTFIVVLGNSGDLRIPLFRRVGLGLIVLAVVLLLGTLVNEIVIPGV